MTKKLENLKEKIKRELAEAARQNIFMMKCWQFPSEVYERNKGLTGISRQWNMPDGISETDLGIHLTTCENHIDREFDDPNFLKTSIEALNKILNSIIDLNPDLKDIAYDDTDRMEVYHVLCGVLSRYNVNDINYFLKMHRIIEEDDDFDHRCQEQRFLQSEGYSLGWIASPETCVSIMRGLNLNYQYDGQEM